MIYMQLLEQIERNRALFPDTVAVVYKNHSLTYEELGIYSDTLVEWICKRFPTISTPIIVYGHMEIEIFIYFLTCSKIGLPYVPVDSSTGKERLKEIVNAVKPELVLCAADIPELFNESDIDLICSSDLRSPSFYQVMEERLLLKDRFIPRMKEKDLYYILFTSGSTGSPKGVMITYGNLNHFINWALKELSFQQGSRIMNHAPYTFDLSVLPLYIALATGGTVVNYDKSDFFNYRYFIRKLKEDAVRIWISTPSFLEMFLSVQDFCSRLLPDIQTFIFCGEVFSKSTYLKLANAFPDSLIYNSYGPTETTVAVAATLINKDYASKYETLPVGKINEYIVLMPDNNDSNQKQEIVIRGPTVCEGYINSEHLNRTQFIDLDYGIGPTKAYKTGDFGFVKDNLLFYVGRMNNQIKYRGYRIEINEIEGNIRLYPGVENVCVLPIYDDSLLKCISILAIIRTHTESEAIEVKSNLKHFLAERLPDYMVPSHLFFVNEFPTTLNGKMDRNKLYDKYRNIIGGGEERVVRSCRVSP